MFSKPAIWFGREDANILRDAGSPAVCRSTESPKHCSEGKRGVVFQSAGLSSGCNYLAHLTEVASRPALEK